jgi:hypothetical protein
MVRLGQILTEQIVGVRGVGVEADRLAQKLGRTIRPIELSFGQREPIEDGDRIRREAKGAFQFHLGFVITPQVGELAAAMPRFRRASAELGSRVTISQNGNRLSVPAEPNSNHGQGLQSLDTFRRDERGRLRLLLGFGETSLTGKDQCRIDAWLSKLQKASGSCATLGQAPSIPTVEGSLPAHVVQRNLMTDYAPKNFGPRVGLATDWGRIRRSAPALGSLLHAME